MGPIINAYDNLVLVGSRPGIYTHERLCSRVLVRVGHALWPQIPPSFFDHLTTLFVQVHLQASRKAILCPATQSDVQ